MSTWDFFQIIFEGALYDICKFAGTSIVVTGAGAIIARKIFKKLNTFRELLIFGACSFFAILVVLLVAAPRDQHPQFSGNIQQFLTGVAGERDTVAEISMSILNSGNMQSIVKNILVEAVVNGSKYHGTFVPAPQQVTFSLPDLGPSSPTSLKYVREDDLLQKANSPIQPGALMIGTLYVIFQGVPADTFKSGADFTVTYQDALSRPYAATLKSTAQMSVAGVMPGLLATGWTGNGGTRQNGSNVARDRIVRSFGASLAPPSSPPWN